MNPSRPFGGSSQTQRHLIAQVEDHTFTDRPMGGLFVGGDDGRKVYAGAVAGSQR